MIIVRGMCQRPAYLAQDLFVVTRASRGLWASIVDEAAVPPPAKNLQDFSWYETKAVDFEPAIWQHVAIPTITVHLTQLATCDDGFHKVSVMVPVCVTLLQ